MLCRSVDKIRRAKWSVFRLAMVICATVVMPGEGQSLSAAPKPAPGVVLDTAGVWRMHHTLKPPLIQQSDGGTKPLLFNVKWLDWETLPPPADWTNPQMNDRTWMRGPARRCARTPYLARLSVRGKFEVTDPSAVGELSLALEYHGGVVAYLNGKEIGRRTYRREKTPVRHWPMLIRPKLLWINRESCLVVINAAIRRLLFAREV